MKNRNEKVIGIIVKALRVRGVRGSLTGVESVDGDILKIFIDGDFYCYFSMSRGELIGEDDDMLGAALADEAGLLAY